MISFDARTAKLLEPGAHLTWANAPGLRLVATASRRTWTYRYKNAGGQMKQIRLGHWPAVTPAAAMVEWERLRAIRDAGGDPAAARKQGRKEVAERKARTKLPTVYDLAHEYVEGHVKPTASASHYTNCRRYIERLGSTGELIAAELPRSEAFDLINGMKGAPTCAVNLKQIMGAAWDYALDAGRLPPDAPNWWRLILRGKLQSQGRTIKGRKVGTAKRVLSDAEVGALLRWLDNYTPAIRDVLTLYLWTGCRGAEIVQIEGREVAEEGGMLWWTLPKGKRKVARHEAAVDLRVPLIGRAGEVVRRRKGEHGAGHLFPGDGVPHIRQHSVYGAVYAMHPETTAKPERERSRLAIAHWTPHDLRRTVRTMLASMGCPSEIAEAIIGHMQPGIEAVYNRYSYDRERVLWLTRLDQHLEGLAAGQHSAAAADPTPAAQPARPAARSRASRPGSR